MNQENYRLGKKSELRLIGVNPVLAFAAQEAIKITEQDFSAFEGVRLLERQRVLVARGVSWTMNSNHLTGNAIDLVAYTNGKLSWDTSGGSYDMISKAMKTVIEKYDLPIEWGFDKWGKDEAHWQMKKGVSTWDIRNILNQHQLSAMIRR